MRCQQLQLLRVSCYQTSFITIYYPMSLGATPPYFGVFPARHCSSALRLEPKLFATNPFGKRMLWLAADLKQKGFRSDEETGSSLALPTGVKHWHGHTHTHAKRRSGKNNINFIFMEISSQKTPSNYLRGCSTRLLHRQLLPPFSVAVQNNRVAMTLCWRNNNRATVRSNPKFMHMIFARGFVTRYTMHPFTAQNVYECTNEICQTPDDRRISSAHGSGCTNYGRWRNSTERDPNGLHSAMHSRREEHKGMRIRRFSKRDQRGIFVGNGKLSRNPTIRRSRNFPSINAAGRSN